MKSTQSSGKKRKLLVSGCLILRILFGGRQSSSASPNSTNFQYGVNSKTEISRVLEKESLKYQKNSSQPEQIMKSSEITRNISLGGDGNSSQRSKFTAGAKAKEAAKINFTRRQGNKKAAPSQRSGGSSFANAFTSEPNFPARPGGNVDGLFGRSTPRPSSDPNNPGCASGPRFITVLSGQRHSDE